MITGKDRVLTTHTGSLPRPNDLTQLMYAHQEGRPVDAEIDQRLPGEVSDIVGRQRAAGIDVVSDGELGKVGYVNYIVDRLAGFGGQAEPWSFTDQTVAPELATAQYAGEAGKHIMPPNCEGEISYVGHEQLRRDLDNLRAAADAHGVEEAFVPATSPGGIAAIFPNKHYPTYQDYLMACADAMREEYEAIVDAGFLLQLDSPDLPIAHPDHGRLWSSYVTQELGHPGFVALQIEAMNQAVATIPKDRMRLHLCWGNYVGTHHFDAPLNGFLQEVLEARPSGLSFEAANPRHAHEWRAFHDVDLPEDKILIPGVIDTLTPFVEHPELVAERIGHFTDLVGKDRVIAGTDCGFGTFVGFGAVNDEVVYLKLDSLARGAALAS